MDLTEALRYTENALRDFIASTMRAAHGEEWVDHCGIPEKTTKKWKIAKGKEEGNQSIGVVEPRLIYYADFNDLVPIIENNWASNFESVFNVDFATMKVWLEALRLVRNQVAHGREILDHQKHLALGAAGEIRTRLIRHRSRMETAEDYFPRIERLNDDVGNVWKCGDDELLKTGITLRHGDVITFTITASDPQDLELEYCIVLPGREWLQWQKRCIIQIELNNEDIGRDKSISAYIRGVGGKHHANGHWDDTVGFIYSILPKK